MDGGLNYPCSHHNTFLVVKKIPQCKLIVYTPKHNSLKAKFCSNNLVQKLYIELWSQTDLEWNFSLITNHLTLGKSSHRPPASTSTFLKWVPLVRIKWHNSHSVSVMWAKLCYYASPDLEAWSDPGVRLEHLWQNWQVGGKLRPTSVAFGTFTKVNEFPTFKN